MHKDEIFERVKALGLLAVIRGPSEELTIKTIEALVKGGVLGIEVTFSTPNAYAVVEKVGGIYGNEILLGMGTLTEAGQVEGAKQRGAQFVVSPIYDEALCEAMAASGMLSMVGCLTPSEIFKAYQHGADIIKIFPGSIGGPSYIKAIKGPFPDIPMMPTGGVESSNVAEWFRAGAIAVGAGSNLCPKDLVLKKDFDAITHIARDFVQVVNNARSA